MSARPPLPLSPLRRRFPGAAHAVAFGSMLNLYFLVAIERPEEPMHCLRPATVEGEPCAISPRCFPGDVLYAVKANPEPACCVPSTPAASRHLTARRSARSRWCARMFPRCLDPFHAPGQSRVAPSARRGSGTVCVTSCSTARRSWRRSGMKQPRRVRR